MAPQKKTPPPKKQPPHKKAAPEKKPHEQGIGMDLVGNPEKFIGLLIKDKEQAAYVLDQLTNEGPAHKQVQNALLLRQLAKLVKAVEQASGTKFGLQDGHNLISKGPEHEMTMPLQLPKTTLKGLASSADVLEKASKGPEHEMLMNALVLQVTDWATATIASMDK